VREEDDRYRSEDLLALEAKLATSIERCVVCGDETVAVGVLSEAEKTRLYGLCEVCAYLMRRAKSPFFLLRCSNNSH
jgi:hypothetical protein